MREGEREREGGGGEGEGGGGGGGKGRGGEGREGREEESTKQELKSCTHIRNLAELSDAIRCIASRVFGS